MLEKIVNYREPHRHGESVGLLVPIGHVRYASSNRDFQNVATVPVAITPTDLLGQKSALFGMTRTGKSNTTKIIIQGDLRDAMGGVADSRRADRVRPDGE